MTFHKGVLPSSPFKLVPNLNFSAYTMSSSENKGRIVKILLVVKMQGECTRREAQRRVEEGRKE